MSKKRSRHGKVQQWEQFNGECRRLAPHVSAWWDDVEEFRELRLKARADGTVLAIAKGFGSDGGEVVCFGVGYSVTAAIMAIDTTIQSGSWQVDKPWGGGHK